VQDIVQGMANRRPVTLITGASSGIGAALAREFAAHGHETFLVARREDRLRTLADSIVAAGHPRPAFRAMDLARRDSGDRLAALLNQQGLEPAIVVNSAGFGMLGAASSLDRDRQLAMIDVNARALTDLSLRFLDSIERHRGGILNVGSVLGFMPGPGMAVYHATKAYVLSFTEALHQELKPRGIRVTVLCPGPIDTEFGVRVEGRLSRRLGRSPERVAREGYRGFVRGERVVVPGMGNRITSMLPRVLPRRLVFSIIGSANRVIRP
jgi:short-subunit dehydrogenase